MVIIDQFMLVALGAGLTGLSWFVQRRITGSHKDEQIDRIDKALQISEKLQQSGMSLEDARLLSDRLATGAVALSNDSLEQIDQTEHPIDEDNTKFTILDSNVAMGAQLDARLQVLNAEIAELMLKLEMLCEAEHWDAVKASQTAWEEYRRTEGNAASVEMAGGTGMTVNALATEISVTEDRIKYLKSFIEEKIELYGEH